MFAANNSAAPSGAVFIEDVFLVNTRSGTGTTATVTGGPDMSTKGGLHITKARSTTTGWRFTDTLRGATFSLDSSSTAAQATESTGLTAFTTSGATFGADADYNASGQTFVDFFIRRAPKFFDVVQYIGDGVAGRQIAHNLGQVPGMVIVKSVTNAFDWIVYHRSLGATQRIQLNQTSGATADTDWANTEPTASAFSVSGSRTNGAGQTYIAYLFAHDTSADGLIQCGSFTDGAGVEVNLGWEPQWVLIKSSSAASAWYIIDAAREFSHSNMKSVQPNSSSAESTAGAAYFAPTATGFKDIGGWLSGNTCVYVAIRRGPMKPPTSAAQFHKQVLRTGTGAVATVTGVGFSPDLYISKMRGGSAPADWYDRLRGATKSINSANTTAEATFTGAVTSFDMDGITMGTDSWSNSSGVTYIYWLLKRYPGVFDEVCWTGNGTYGLKNHSLGVAPELCIMKSRSNAQAWFVWQPTVAKVGNLNSTSAFSVSSLLTASATQFTPYDDSNGFTFVAYLFATKTGLSKCFSYTGNGGSLTVDCSFATGASFIMLKRTDSTSDWFIWSASTGIVAGNDPHLSLNTTAAEVATDDSIDPDASGFIVNQLSATNINVNGGTYIGFAIAT